MVQATAAVADLIAGEDRAAVVVGGRTFYQSELGIQQAAEVTESVLSLMSSATSDGTLRMADIESMDTADVSTVFPILAKLARVLPQLLGDVFCAVLTDEDDNPLDAEARSLVHKKLKLRQAMGMVRTFVAQNDLPDVIASFFSTRDAVSAGVQDLRTQTAVEAKTTPL